MSSAVRRLCVAVALASVVVVALPQAASAAWSSATGSEGAARSTAAAMPSGNQPVATASTPAGSTVDVAWAASGGGAPVAGYEVRSYDATTGTPRTVGASCAGVVAGTSCSETDVPDGSWRYSVIPRLEAWVGAESPLSDPVVIDSSYSALVMADGPRAYWRLGESSGTTAFDEMDVSDGTYSGGYSLGAQGALINDANTAVDFNGSTGEVSIPSVPQLALTSQVTIEAWVNPDTMVGTRFVVNKGTWYYLYVNFGTTIFGIHSGSAYLFITTPTVTAGAWQHLVGTYDGANLVLYRNGVVVAQAPTTGAITSTTAPVLVSQAFDGRLDEVALYGTALSQAQVLAHYQRGNGTRPDTVITFPVNDFAYNDAVWNASCGSSICGTARDTGGGVASVAVSVRQASSGNFWNGTAFASATEVLLPATGTTSWTLPFPGANFPFEGSYTVRAVGTDGAGNAGTMTTTFTIDRTAPTAAFTFPAAGGTYANTSWNAGCASRICGTAADTGSAVIAVSVSIRQGSGNYWNGTSFGSATEVFLTATGTTSWTLAFPATNFPAIGSYTVRAVAMDLAFNFGETSRTFTIDRTAPTAVTTVPVAGGVYNDGSWNAGCTSTICGTAADVGSQVAAVYVSIRQGSGNYWNGTSFGSATEVFLIATGTTSWTLPFPATNFPANGSYTVRAYPVDSAGNVGVASTTFTIDRTAPTVATTFPVAGGVYNDASWNAGCTSTICGTAADVGSSVASVSVSIRQGSGNYWNGTAFASATEVLLPATGTTSWSLPFPAASFPAEGSYTVRAVATDLGGTTATTSTTFTIDRTSPAPTGLTLFDASGFVTPGTDEVRITFSEALNVSSVCSAWSGSGDKSLGGSNVVVTITDSLVNDVLTVAAGACTLNIGSVATGRDYVVTTSTFSGSTVATESRVTWTAATRVLTIHLGSQTGGLLNVLPQAAATATYTPNAAITDLGGNGVVTTPFSSAGQRL